LEKLSFQSDKNLVFTSQMRAMNPSVLLLMVVSVLSSTQAGKMVFERMVDVTPNGLCPDGSSCSSSQTCCKTSSGEYSCCPYAGAQCCRDGLHCCPSGYTCDLSAGKCTRTATNETRQLAVKLPSQSPLGSERLVCPDGSSCSGTAACCRTYVNSYTCCAYPNDVCCDDGRHCCARLTICDQRTLTCLPGDKSAPWDRPVASVAAIPAPEETTKLVPIVERQASPAPNLICPGGGSCPGTAACCRTYSGGYNCCNYPKDVCCSDGLHCCARGTICDVRNLTCIPGEKSLPWDKPTPATPSI
jgi:hypothetical protein